MNRPIARVTGVVAGIAATMFGLFGVAPLAAQSADRSVAPERAPASWVAYAGLVRERVTAWVTSDDEPAKRVHAYLDAMRPADDKSSAPVSLSLWFDAKGVIIRAEFPPFVDDAVNADLRGLLVGHATGTPPPKGMLEPLRLSVQLDPAPDSRTMTESDTPSATRKLP